MTSEIPFKRTVREHNGCYYISIPLKLIKAKRIKKGHKLDFTVDPTLNQIQVKEISEAAQPSAALNVS